MIQTMRLVLEKLSDHEALRYASPAEREDLADRIEAAAPVAPADGLGGERERIIDAIQSFYLIDWNRMDGEELAVAILAVHTPAGEVAWSCKKCNSPRPGTESCWKCGGPLKKPADGWEWPGLPDIDRIRALAKEVGYAVGVHGSMERDLDLIAAPWVAEAVSPLELAQHIAEGLGGRVVDAETQDKPCSRWSCNIHTPDWTKMIDLSVMPPAPNAALEAQAGNAGRDDAPAGSDGDRKAVRQVLVDYGFNRITTPEAIDRILALAARAHPPAGEARCQACGGEVQGYMCQYCDATFTENDDGYLIIHHPEEPVAWLRDAHEGRGDECLVPAAKGDPGAFPVYARPDEAEIADLKSAVVTFAAPHAVRYAADRGMPKGHLHPTHFDLLERCGARMDDFTRGSA